MDILSQLQQGLAFHQAGQLTSAQHIYEAVLKVMPHEENALHFLGVIYHQNQAHDTALSYINQALSINPQLADAYNNRGNVFKAMGQPEQALSDYNTAIQLKPQDTTFYNNRGIIYDALGKLDEALADYAKTIELSPNYADAYSNRGLVFEKLKQFDKAIADYDRALALNPNLFQALYNRGIALKNADRLPEAVSSYRRALALQPHFANAHNNLGNALSALQQFDEALSAFNQAIALDDSLSNAYHNRATLRLYRHEFQHALADYQQAITLKADYADAHLGRSILLLLQGEFELGWRDYEWRFSCPHFPTPKRYYPNAPLWLGETPLRGKTILLHSEQGLGDTLQFCRYANVLAAQGAKVILETHPPLLDIMRSMPAIQQVIAMGDALPAFDVHCPLMSLSLACQTFSEESIPRYPNYLIAHPSQVARWQTLIVPSSLPKIGLVWRGGSLHKGDKQRSFSLKRLLEVLPRQAQYLSLQQTVSQEERDLMQSFGVQHVDNSLNSFDDTAGLCAHLDLIISVDTAVAHLAGALGKPVWLLLPFNPDWRWLLARADSPWYPSMRLFRQSRLNDWQGVLESVRDSLQDFGIKIPS